MKKLILAIAAFSFLAVSQAKAEDAAPKDAAPKAEKSGKKAHKGGKKSKKGSGTTTPPPK